jgi:hypothetical protein
MADDNRRNGGRRGKEIAKAGRGSALRKGQMHALLSESLDTKGK